MTPTKTGTGQRRHHPIGAKIALTTRANAGDAMILRGAQTTAVTSAPNLAPERDAAVRGRSGPAEEGTSMGGL